MSFRILIVEDDASFRRLVEIRLRTWQPTLEIVAAESVAEAEQTLSDSPAPFDLVILDQHLPDGLGPQLLEHPKVIESTVLAVSADDGAEVPARALKAGAQHFLGKRQISEPLFLPLLEALLERKKMEKELLREKIKESRMETIKVLLGTLRHEINNPLGAVIGGAYLVRTTGELSREQKEALQLIEASGNRIKHALNQLCEAAELEEVTKGQEQVFQIPGDKPWAKK